MAESLIPDWVLQIIIASVGATISGIVLLLIHHFRVKQEIELHKRIDEFDRKQIVYRHVLDDVNEKIDYMFYLGQDLNWRKGKKIYNELILTGSKSVIDAYNEFVTNYKMEDPKEDSKIKKILVEIRKDLYGDEFKTEDIKMVNPGKAIMAVLEIIGKNKEIFEANGFNNVKSFANMDIGQIYEITEIPKTDLEKIKKLAIQDKERIEEVSKFKDSL